MVKGQNMAKKNYELIKDPEKALAYTLEQMQPWAGADAWVVPQSGGKDSRTVAQAQLVLIKRGLLEPPKAIYYMMADTLMEFWSFQDQAIKSMNEMAQLAQSLGIQARVDIVRPAAIDDFWVRILGSGYIPPTPNMRSCTDKLKSGPMRKLRYNLQIESAPVFLGVRYGESARRDETMTREEAKAERRKLKPEILSCTVGGECGPDFMFHSRIENKVSPIDRWRQCAVWDFLNFIAPVELDVNNDGLAEHYGPDLDLRYGCWSCPLIFNDKTAEYMKHSTPILYDLIIWTNAHLRRGGSAWRSENREEFLREDGRLSMRWCKDRYEDLLRIGANYGIELLSLQQKAMIKAIWLYREALPPAQHGHDRHPLLLTAEPPTPKQIDIKDISEKTAAIIAQAPLPQDEYGRALHHGATVLMQLAPDRVWKYQTQYGESTTLWKAVPNAVNPNRGTATISRTNANISDTTPEGKSRTRDITLNYGF